MAVFVESVIIAAVVALGILVGGGALARALPRFAIARVSPGAAADVMSEEAERTASRLRDGETRVQGYASTFSALDPNVLGVTVNVFGPRNQIRSAGFCVTIARLTRLPFGSVCMK